MKKSLSILSILAAIAAVYAPSLWNGFVWDDTALVLRDPLIRSWRLIPEGFNHFLFTDATASDFYRPIQRLTYTIEYAAAGLHPATFHTVSILCHAAAAIALLFLASELLSLFGVAEQRRRWIAFLAAFVWAIHPVHNAAVVYISGRADPLAAAFGFIGIYFGLRFLRGQGASRYGLLFLCGIALLLSVLSKESGFVLMAILVAILALRRQWRALLQIGLAVAFVCAIYFSLRLGAEHHPAPRLQPAPPLLVKPLLAARALAEYTGLMVLPLKLYLDRDVETRPSGFAEESLNAAAWKELQTVAGIVLLGLFIYWMMRARKRNTTVFALLVLTAIAYLPISGVFQLNATVAEHWIYLPSAFLFLAAATALSDRSWQGKTAPLLQRLSMVLLALWVVFLGARTFRRTFDWKDQRTFFESAIQSGASSARMLINLGGLELSEGNLPAAAQHFHRALDKEPGQPLAILNLAAVALKQNDFKLARELLLRAVDMPLVDAQAHEMLAVLEHKERQTVDLRRLRLATRTGAPNWSIEKRFIKVLDETGRTDTAIEELQRILRRAWYRAESWKLLSDLLAKSGRRDEAALALKLAHRYDTRLPEAAKVP